MKYVIWGAGKNGKRLFRHLKKEDVIAFVDVSQEKIGGKYCEKEVISIEEYTRRKQYKNTILVIAHTFKEEAVAQLKELGVKNYMLLSDCPSEFQTENTKHSYYLRNFIKKRTNKDSIYGILGCTVYGLEVYSWLCEFGNNHSYLIIDESVSTQMVEVIQNSNYRTIMMEEVTPECIDRIIDCRYIENNEINNIFENIEQDNIYDCSDRIMEYYNLKIEKLKNIHKDKSCFIVATGPSLKIEDLNTLAEKNVLTFGVNGIGRAYIYTQWRPTYYVAGDRAQVESDYFATIKPEEQSEYAFIGDESEVYWQIEHKPNVLKQHICHEFAIGRYPKFSENLARKSYVGGTIVYICFQLAIYMGFKKIYLLGTDFTNSEEQGSKYGHFYEEKNLISVCYAEQVKACYEKVREYADDHGIKIYNATRGGKLEIFPRVDFDSLFI